jgi:hypothetical protein
MKETIECVVDSIRQKNSDTVRFKLRPMYVTSKLLKQNDALFFECDEGNWLVDLTVRARVFLTLTDEKPEGLELEGEET